METFDGYGQLCFTTRRQSNLTDELEMRMRVSTQLKEKQVKKCTYLSPYLSLSSTVVEVALNNTSIVY